MGRELAVGLALAVTVLAPLFALLRVVRTRRDFGSASERATFSTLHTASLAAPPLRGGLDRGSAQRSGRHLRALLGSAAVSLTDDRELLAWDGAGDHHALQAFALSRSVLDSGRTVVVRPLELTCGEPDCPVAHGVVAPITLDERVVGTLAAWSPDVGPGLVRAVGEVARWVSSQLQLAELDLSRSRLAQAEVRALRAQISPHFVYNSLTAIASFVRTDPERARELLLEFADFTRYSFRTHGDFTTLSEELRSIDRYLLLERARFGDRLQVTLRVAPEVLPVALPFLSLQPLVENAVRHGLEGRAGEGTITIVAEDTGAECRISVEDDGVGMDPDRLLQSLRAGGGDHVGLGNVDERLRSVFGPDYGLVVETAPGAGTKVSMRVPKYRSGVRAS